MKKAFTLVELLVVIAVIGILSAIITPNLLNARNSARIAAGQRFDSSVYHSIGDYLVGEWMFDVPGSALIDTSGFINNGSTSSYPVYYQTGGYNGKGTFSFDGTDDYITITNPSAFSFTNNFTLSAWIYPTSYHTTGYYGLKNLVIGKGTGPTVNYMVQVSSDTSISFIKRTGAEGLVFSNFTDIPSLGNKWTNVVVTILNNSIKLYINGSFIDAKSVVNIAPTVNDVLFIGNSPSGGSPETNFIGFIDDIRIYASALSSSEIEKLYTETKGKYLTKI